MSIGDTNRAARVGEPINAIPQQEHVHHHSDQCHNWQDMRLIRGGAVATINALSEARGSGSPTTPYRIYFKQMQPGVTNLCAIIQPGQPEEIERLADVASCKIVFGHNGDLRNQYVDDNMHSVVNLAASPSFWAGEPGTETDSLVVALTGTRCTLDLNPQTGIIGRRVSIIHDNGSTLGDGVVGWN